ncbi:MAG: ABC transporter ATP-binding protein, partial [Pseudoclavibacter sp.]
REGVDAALREGRSTVLVGPNGAGKTTLALTLAGLLRPLGGEVTAASGLAAAAGPNPHRWRSRELLTRIGTVFQQPEHQFVAPTVRRELEVGPRALRRDRAVIDATVGELLAALRLERLAEANPFTLSGGEKRRLSVATALATAPRVIVLDEPTFGQDRETWRELVTLMARLVADGTTLLSVTHDAALIDALGDDVLRIDELGAPA